MRQENFCKILIITFINFISFLLSTIFLVSVNNAKEQSYYLSHYYICDYQRLSDNDIYSNYYKGIATLFSFSLLGFFIFIVILSVIIYREKILNADSEMDDNTIQKDVDINNEQYSENRVIGYKSETKVKYPIALNENFDELDNNKKMNKILIISFCDCLLMYFIEVILITALYQGSKNNTNKIKKYCNNNKKDFDSLTRIFIDLLIVGYIFLFIFIALVVYLLILYDIFGEKSKRFMHKCTYYKCSYFFNKYGEKICSKCIDIFKIKTEEEKKSEDKKTVDELRKNIDKKDIQIKELEEYKNNLEKLNKDYSNGHLNERELAKLNLYKIIK